MKADWNDAEFQSPAFFSCGSKNAVEWSRMNAEIKLNKNQKLNLEAEWLKEIKRRFWNRHLSKPINKPGKREWPLIQKRKLTSLIQSNLLSLLPAFNSNWISFEAAASLKWVWLKRRSRKKFERNWLDWLAGCRNLINSFFFDLPPRCFISILFSSACGRKEN